MAYTNDSKPELGITTWVSITTTWATETNTWASVSSSYTNDTKPS